MAADDIHAMSEVLAADPGSLVFLPLAEALLARGDLASAMRVATRGAGRHPARIDGHDLVARVALAQGDDARAEDAWGRVLGIDASFGTAHRGLGLVRYRQGRLDEAQQHLAYAAYVDPSDHLVRTALEAVQRVIAQRDHVAGNATAGAAVGAAADAGMLDAATAAVTEAESGPMLLRAADHGPDRAGESAARLFDPVLDGTKQIALLLDADGLVSAGQYMTGDGRDLGSEIGAHLTGVSDEAARAMRHFKLGRWTRLAIEAEAATISMAPMEAHFVLVAAPRDVPLGFVRRTLERGLAVARAWLAEGA